MPVPAGIDV
ncbi:hypothetical protein A2U01_0089412, partial [Trifolium medium]|nr:hypothetical protein [Trifolium medium]